MLFDRFQAHLQAYSTFHYGLTLLLTGRPRGPELLTAAYTFFPDGGRYFFDGTPTEISLMEKKTTLSIQDEAGLINLRLAPEELVGGLLKYFNVGQDRQKIVVNSLKDWIDGDDVVRINGAEKRAYEALGYEPRNGPPLTVDEISMVKGVDDDLLEQVRPFLYLGFSAGVNPNVAPWEVLMSFPNMTEEGARRIMTYRKAAYIGSTEVLSTVSGVGFYFYDSLFAFSRGQSVFIKAASLLGEKNQYTISCRLRRSFGPGFALPEIIDPGPLAQAPWNPYEIVSWREQIE
jgi:general secretion pathway protein K